MRADRSSLSSSSCCAWQLPWRSSFPARLRRDSSTATRAPERARPRIRTRQPNRGAGSAEPSAASGAEQEGAACRGTTGRSDLSSGRLVECPAFGLCAPSVTVSGRVFTIAPQLAALRARTGTRPSRLASAWPIEPQRRDFPDPHVRPVSSAELPGPTRLYPRVTLAPRPCDWDDGRAGHQEPQRLRAGAQPARRPRRMMHGCVKGRQAERCSDQPPCR
jgi:hypothetical protein